MYFIFRLMFILTLLLGISAISVARLGELSEGEWVELRGFLYYSQEGEWVLASQPNLKSCCVNPERHGREQVVVIGWQGEMPKRAVTLTGLLQREGGRPQLVLSSEGGTFLSSATNWWGVGLLLSALLLIWLILRRTRRGK